MPAGTIEAFLEGAMGIKDTEMIGKADPYALICCGKTKLRSNTANKHGSKPVWNQKFSFYVDDTANDLEVIIMNQNTITNDEELGRTKIPLAKVFAETKLPTTSYNVVRPSGRVQGQVKLSLSFTAKQRKGGQQALVNTMLGPYNAKTHPNPYVPAVPPKPPVKHDPLVGPDGYYKDPAPKTSNPPPVNNGSSHSPSAPSMHPDLLVKPDPFAIPHICPRASSFAPVPPGILVPDAHFDARFVCPMIDPRRYTFLLDFNFKSLSLRDHVVSRMDDGLGFLQVSGSGSHENYQYPASPGTPNEGSQSSYPLQKHDHHGYNPPLPNVDCYGPPFACPTGYLSLYNNGYGNHSHPGGYGTRTPPAAFIFRNWEIPLHQVILHPTPFMHTTTVPILTRMSTLIPHAYYDPYVLTGHPM